jgi:hypothetical protein
MAMWDAAAQVTGASAGQMEAAIPRCPVLLDSPDLGCPPRSPRVPFEDASLRNS